MADDKIRLGLEIVGTEDAEALRSKFAELKTAANENAVAFSKGEKTAEEYVAAARQIEPALTQITKALREVEKAEKAASDAREQARREAQANAAALKAGAEAANQAAAAARARAKADAEATAAAKAETDAITAAGGADKYLAQQIEAVRDAQKRLRSEFDGGRLTLDQYTQKSRDLAAQEARFQAATVAGARNLGSMRERITGLTYALNDFFAVQGDLSQRLNAISNNLPMLMAGFGGLGLALSAIVPVIGLVIKNWDHFKDAFGKAVDDGKGRVEQLKERIKELEAKPVRVAVDTAELENARKEVEALTAALQAAERLRKSQRHYEKASGEAIEETLVNAKTDAGEEIGGEEALRRLAGTRANEIVATSPKIREAKDEAAQAQAEMEALDRRVPTSPEEARAMGHQRAQAQARRDAARQRATDIEAEIRREGGAAEQSVGGLIEEAEKGHGGKQARAREQLAGLARRTPGLKNLGESVAITTPESLQEQEETEERVEETVAQQQRGAKARGEREREAARRKAEADAERTAEGKRVEDEAKRQQAERKRADALDRARKDRQIRERNRGVQQAAQGFDDQATLAAAQLRAQGGVVDDRGRFRQMNAFQQRQFLESQVYERLKRNDPRMRGLPGMLAAQQTAGKAFRGVDTEVRGARAEAENRAVQLNLDATAKNQAAMEAGMGAIQNVLQRAEAAVRKAEMLRRNFGRLERQSRPTGGTYLNSGSPGG